MSPARVPHWQGRAVERSVGGARQRSAERAQRVVDAVRSLAAERGSAEFTMAEVAAASGVPLRSLYRQFPGRDEVLLALLEDDSRLGAEILGGRAAGAPDPGEGLRLFVLGLWEFMAEGSGYASALVREHLRLAERHPQETRSALQPLVELLASLAGAHGGAAPAGAGGGGPLVLFSVLLAHMQALLLFRPDCDTARAGAAVWQVFRSILDAADQAGDGGSDSD